MHQSYIVMEKFLRKYINNRLRRIIALYMAAALFLSSSADFYVYAEMFGGTDVSEDTFIETVTDETETDEIVPVLDEEADEPENEPLRTITISKFDIEIIDGYTRTDDDVYVWEANTSAEGHTFMFNILFETSGNDYIYPNEVKITIPNTILNNKEGNSADACEMSVPDINLITEELKELSDWAYYVDEQGNLVITNVVAMPAGQTYFFNVGYKTTQETFDYEDMQKSSRMHADLEFSVKGSEEKRSTSDLYVAIDTSVQITQTNKKKPVELYKGWDNLWGTKPDDADDYYYLIWEVETIVDTKSTQYYNFSLSDEQFRVVIPERLADTELKVIGYNYSGNGNQYLLDSQAENQTILGTRHDFVLTAVPKEIYDDLQSNEEVILENTVNATVDPVDGKDDDSSASAVQTYPLKKPKFNPPIGSYKIDKKGDRDNYQLDLFTDDKTAEKDLSTYDYTITASGHTYSYTYDGNDPEDYQNYGKKKLHYVLTDDTVSLEGYVGDYKKSDNYELKKSDYYFTSVGFNYDINIVSGFDNAESKDFILTKPDSKSGIYFDVYGDFILNGNAEMLENRKIARIWTYGNSNIEYESGMGSYAEIKNYDTGFSVKFNNDDIKCTGYQIISSDDCYYSTAFTVKPSIQLVKNNTDLQTWININYGKESAEKNENKVTKLLVTNTANMKIYTENEDAVIFDADASGTDAQIESKKESAISKTIAGTTNNTLYKRYEIAWKIEISEYVLVSNTGASHVPVTQYGGEFFDLLPMGSSVDMSTVHVYKEDNQPVEFTAKTLPGTDNRVLLRVTVASDQPGEKYILNFTSYHSWEDIASFGSEILNPAAYVTKNEEMANTQGAYKRGRNNGENVELMMKSINSTGDYWIEENPENEIYNRTIFNYEPFDIKAAVMANVGVNKTVKNAKEGSYTTKTVIDASEGGYSYRVRLENSRSAKSIDNVLVDFLEDFENKSGIKSMWQGTLKSIDVTNLLSKNVIPKVYYSTKKYRINESDVWYVDENNHEIKIVETLSDEENSKMNVREFLPQTVSDPQTDDGNDYWTLIPCDFCVNGVYNLRDDNGQSVLGVNLRDITAIAIDYTYADEKKFDASQIEIDKPGADNLNAKITSAGKYIMGFGEAAYVIINMDNSDVKHPEPQTSEADNAYQEYLNGYNTYNDIFSATKIFNSGYTSSSAQENWMEQNYTTVSYRIRNNFYLKKTNVNNQEETLGGITFNLSGVSWYGTKVNINMTTTSSGLLEFEDLEAGVYTLIEVDCGRDWQIDRTEYKVTVDADSVTVDPDLNTDKEHSMSDTPFILTNKPRAHADIAFDKILYADGKPTSIGIDGATFKLSGTSDYGNEIVKIAVSDYSGRVFFEDVEQGTYELREIEAPDGYALSNIIYTVRVDANNNWEITSADKNAMLNFDSSHKYTIGNEKYQEFYLKKYSTEPVGKDRDVNFLEGAEFNLYGTTWDNKVVNMTEITKDSKKYNEAVAHFNNLERGTYYLREVTPPTYIYEDEDGENVEQRFYLDETIYTVIVDENGVTITAPDGTELAHVMDGDAPISDLYKFENTPVGGKVIIRKLWNDHRDSLERAENVETPDIVISREPPEPFKISYAEFDYSYSNAKAGRFGLSINKYKNDLKNFKRYIGRADISYGRLLIDGVDVGAEIISKTDSEDIYGWLDAETSTYYWYTKAIGAKLPTARDLFTGTKIVKADFGGIDFSETATFAYMFNGCSTLEDVIDLTRPEDSETTPSAMYMFNSCNNLGKNGKIDFSEFYTNGFTSMEYMFNQAMKAGTNINIVLEWGEALNTSSVTTFFHMFDTCNSLISLNAEIDVNGVTASNGLEYMFCNCSQIVNFPIVKRDKETKTAVSVCAMFRGLTALSALDLSKFYTNGVTNMSSLFYESTKLTSLNISHFNTSSVTDMSYMFYKMTLKKLEINNFDTSQVKSMAYMFAQCQSLEEITLTNFDTSNVENMSNMFDNCEKIQYLDLSSFTSEKLKSANTMFCNCKSLITIWTQESFDLSVIAGNSNNMFLNDSKLKGDNGTVHDKGTYPTGTQPDDRDWGKYARVDGGTANHGYFSRRNKPNQRPALLGKNIFMKSQDDESKPSSNSLTGSSTADGPDYRSSANHNNQSGPSAGCPKDHFFVIKTQEEAEALKDDYPEIYALVQNIQDNEWIYIFDDLVGEGFHVWEENVPYGYESNYDNFLDEDGNHRITNVVDGVATITNKHTDYKSGTLAISKTLINAEDNQDVTYHFNTKYVFTIQLFNTEETLPQNMNAVYYKTDDEENTKSDLSVLFIDGKAMVEIQSGYTLKFNDVPENTEYIITESENEDVKSTKITVNNNDNTQTFENAKEVDGVILADTGIFVEYQNKIEADVREKGDFMLKKSVENENDAADANAEYAFTIELTNLVKNTEYYIYNNNGEVVKTFTPDIDQNAAVVVYLKADDIFTFKDIPENASYRITEAAGSAYISSYIISTGESSYNTAAGNELTTQWQEIKPNDSETINFTNKIVKVQSLSVSKNISGEEFKDIDEEIKTANREKNYKFVIHFSNLGSKYQLIAAGQATFIADESGNLDIEFYLKAGESYNFTNIPVGAVYSIYEDYDGELIPYYEVTHTDETTGGTQKINPAPSTSSGKDMTNAVKDAQAELDKKQTAYTTAESLLNYNKKELDSVINKIINQLTDEQKKEYNDDIQMFTADNFINCPEKYNVAHERILKIFESFADKTALEDAEAELEKTAADYQSASEALKAAQDALVAARGAAYVEGSIEVNKDTAIDFSNNYSFDLTVNKQVTGIFGDLQKDFYFKIEFSYNNVPFTGSYDAELFNQARITDSTYQSDDTSGIFMDGTVYFILRHNDKITFKNLPYGTDYKIIEEEAKDYEVIVAGQILEDRTVSNTIKKDASVEYVNNWNGTIPYLPGTGAGIGKKMFYLVGIILLTEGFIGAVLLYKRRRN